MPVRLTRELRAEGLGSSAIRKLVREQELQPLRRGAYATELDEGARRHVQLIAATVPRLAAGQVLSHVSAAILHGLPVDARTTSRVTVTKPGNTGGRIGPYVHRYRTPLAEGDIELVDGLRRTVLARTVVDLARHGDLGFAVAAADRALRHGLTKDELSAQLVAARRRYGVAGARAMVDLVDGRSESAGESLSRVVLWRLGMPPDELQFEVNVGGVCYRSDFAWLEQRVLGEFDGKVKYGELLRAGETAADAVMREKRREGQLRAAGWWVVRWTYADVMNPDRLAELLRPALEAGRAAAR